MMVSTSSPALGCRSPCPWETVSRVPRHVGPMSGAARLCCFIYGPVTYIDARDALLIPHAHLGFSVWNHTVTVITLLRHLFETLRHKQCWHLSFYHHTAYTQQSLPSTKMERPQILGLLATLALSVNGVEAWWGAGAPECAVSFPTTPHPFPFSLLHN